MLCMISYATKPAGTLLRSAFQKDALFIILSCHKTAQTWKHHSMIK